MPGEGRLSDCLTKQELDEENGNVDGKKMSEDCKVELRAFKADRSTNINKNLQLGEQRICYMFLDYLDTNDFFYCLQLRLARQMQTSSAMMKTCILNLVQ